MLPSLPGSETAAVGEASVTCAGATPTSVRSHDALWLSVQAAVFYLRSPRREGTLPKALVESGPSGQHEASLSGPLPMVAAIPQLAGVSSRAGKAASSTAETAIVRRADELAGADKPLSRVREW
jgi:hypothetical protein